MDSRWIWLCLGDKGKKGAIPTWGLWAQVCDGAGGGTGLEAMATSEVTHPLGQMLGRWAYSRCRSLGTCAHQWASS